MHRIVDDRPKGGRTIRMKGELYFVSSLRARTNVNVRNVYLSLLCNKYYNKLHSSESISHNSCQIGFLFGDKNMTIASSVEMFQVNLPPHINMLP